MIAGWHKSLCLANVIITGELNKTSSSLPDEGRFLPDFNLFSLADQDLRGGIWLGFLFLSPILRFRATKQELKILVVNMTKQCSVTHEILISNVTVWGFYKV